MTNPLRLFAAVLCTSIGISFIPSISMAQNVSRDLERKIRELDELANQMSWRYDRERQRYRTSPDSRALYSQIKYHNILTDRLGKAAQGHCVSTFSTAAREVRNSVTTMEKLCVRADVSRDVETLISRSCPLSSYIKNNVDQFHPVRPSEPEFDPVYFQLGREIQDIERLSVVMASTYYNEVGYNCSCSVSRALLDEMQNYTTLTGKLVSAYRGNCPKSFALAAREVRSCLSEIEVAGERVSLSSRVAGLIGQSCPKTTFVKDNASHFRPYDGGRTCGTPAPGFRPAESFRAEDIRWRP